MAHGMRKISDKKLASQIDCMIWSNRMDLVAVSNAKGEVSLHRLSWTETWRLAPPRPGLRVRKIAFRPDAKVLALAYADGYVRIVDVESKKTLKTFELTGELSCMIWVQENCSYHSDDVLRIALMGRSDSEDEKVEDLSKTFVKDPPPVSNLEGAIHFDDIKVLNRFLQNQSYFSLLVTGTSEGIISVRVFGCWNCVTLDVSEKVGYKSSIKDVLLSEDFSKLFVTVVDEANNINTVVLNTFMFRRNSAELFHVSRKYIKLYELTCYLEKIIASITETWESILLEIDAKLAKYASQVPEGGVTADFLELLTCGVCSERLEEFLIRDLTKKGLENFGKTMETSYSNIQSHLLKHIVRFSQNGVYHLSELKGMAAFKKRFGVLGLKVDLIQHAIRANSAFIIKANEMQEIINTSVMNYKCFFRWLYAAFMNLLDEPVPAEVQKVTQQDMASIAEFIQHFDSYGQSDKPGGSQQKFVMERVGQYLLNQDLKIKPDMAGNDWTALMAENPILQNHPSMIPHYPDKSLIQVYNEMKANIDNAFVPTLAAIGSLIVPLFQFRCFNFGTPDIVMSSFNATNDLVLLAIRQPLKSVHTIHVHFSAKGHCLARSANFNFIQELSINPENPEDPTLDVLDLQYYSEDILTLLLQECTYARRACLFQLSIPLTIPHLRPLDLTSESREEAMESVVNAWELAPRRCKMIDMLASNFAISGLRKVCILLGKNKRKVKVYELECDDEDDEEREEMDLMVKDDYDE